MKSMTFFIALLAIALIMGCGGGGGSSTSANIAPSVSINASTTTGNAPLTVSFSAIATDTDGSIASYAWNFGDSETVRGQAFTIHFLCIKKIWLKVFGKTEGSMRLSRSVE